MPATRRFCTTEKSTMVGMVATVAAAMIITQQLAVAVTMAGFANFIVLLLKGHSPAMATRR
jgi:hypothetical protein